VSRRQDGNIERPRHAGTTSEALRSRTTWSHHHPSNDAADFFTAASSPANAHVCQRTRIASTVNHHHNGHVQRARTKKVPFSSPETSSAGASVSALITHKLFAPRFEIRPRYGPWETFPLQDQSSELAAPQVVAAVAPWYCDLAPGRSRGKGVVGARPCRPRLFAACGNVM
jgi:hypothetical protein